MPLVSQLKIDVGDTFQIRRFSVEEGVAGSVSGQAIWNGIENDWHAFQFTGWFYIKSQIVSKHYCQSGIFIEDPYRR